MELDLGPEIDQFRSELRDWIAEHAPPLLAGLIDWRVAAIPGGHRTSGLTKALRHPAYAQWERALADARPAPEVHSFCPVMTISPPSISPRVCTPARSDP